MPASGTQLRGAQLITFCLSLGAAFVAAVNAFYNPVKKWQQVRDATAEMKSQIWQYRTRSGSYAQGAEGPGPSIQALSAAVRSCREAIMVSADVEGTSFHKFYSRNIFVHGQRPTVGAASKVSPTDQSMTGFGHQTRQAGSSSTKLDALDPEEPEWQERAYFDNHYSPAPPEDYIQLRLLTMLRFYRKRLPRYATFKDFSQWLIMIGTSVGALIAYLGFAPHVAITSAATSSIAAWMEFSATVCPCLFDCGLAL